MKLKNSKNKELLRLVTKFEPWDFGFTLNIERAMYKKQYEFFNSEEVHCYDNKLIARDLKWVIGLLNIILHEDDAAKLVDNNKWELTKYVNPKNAYRFLPKEFSMSDRVLALDCLRFSKAWCLFHKLKFYKQLGWWD